MLSHSGCVSHGQSNDVSNNRTADEIIVMICYARSGGTVLNQVLGRLPNVVIMSEVNPMGGGTGWTPKSPQTIAQQAKTWYGIELANTSFADSAIELAEHCRQTSRRLILRDWTFTNFAGPRPANRLATLDSLEERRRVTPFAFVRNAIDVCLSLNAEDPDFFFTQYLNYVKELVRRQIPIFRYEDFSCRPAEELESICKLAGLSFIPTHLDYHRFRNVNGDVQTQGLSRGMQQRAIRPLPRKFVPRAQIERIDRCPAMIEANRLLDYPTTYADYWSHETRLKALRTRWKGYFANLPGVTRRLYYKLTYRFPAVEGSNGISQSSPGVKPIAQSRQPDIDMGKELP